MIELKLPEIKKNDIIEKFKEKYFYGNSRTPEVHIEKGKMEVLADTPDIIMKNGIVNDFPNINCSGTYVPGPFTYKFGLESERGVLSEFPTKKEQQSCTCAARDLFNYGCKCGFLKSEAHEG